MDFPRLHYLAGKVFFIGDNIHADALLGPGTIPHLSEYLLVKRHPEWVDMTFDSKTATSFLKSLKDNVLGVDLTTAPAFKLKVYLSNSGKFSLTQQEKQLFMVEAIPLITGKAKNEDAWQKAGLKNASYRRKAEFIMLHIGRHRNWIVPYPIDGLKALLEEGITHGASALEKNWCALQEISYLMYEGASTAQIKAVMDRLERDKDGRVLLEERDENLWESVQKKIKTYSARGA
jgi:hypothetical protein